MTASDRESSEPELSVGIPAPEPDGRILRLPFVILFVAGLANFLGMGATTPILPRHMKEVLGSADISVGIVMGAMAFSAVAIRPWAARWADRHGRRSVMIVGALVTGASYLGYFVAPNVETLIVFRLLTGAGQALFFTGAATLATESVDASRRGAAVSYFSVAVYLGVGFGPAVGEMFYRHYSSYWSFVVATGFAAGAVAAALFYRERPISSFLESDEGTERQPLIARAALLPGVVLALGLIASTTFGAFMPLYSDELGMGGAQYVFILYALIIIGMRLFGANIPDRLGMAKTGTAATTIIGVGMLLIAVVATPAGLYAGAAVFAVGASLHYPALMALVVNRASDRERSSVVATFTAFFDLAQGLGGFVAGSLAQAAGYRFTFVGAAAAAMLGLFVLRMFVLRPPAAGTPAPA